MKLNIKIWIIACVFSGCFLSCMGDKDLGDFDYEPVIAVEGWIENDDYARVLLSISASFNNVMDTTNLMEHVIRSALVKVCDDDTCEILILARENQYLPPFVYYGTVIKGIPGKEYNLSISYRGEEITATTYIPESVPLEGIHFEKNETDTAGYIHISFYNTISPENYYQVLTRIEDEETLFIPCLYGNIDGESFQKDELVSLQVNKGPRIFPETSYQTYFVTGNTIHVKFRTQPKHGYDFWSGWQNEVINAQNPIFPADKNLKSNISGGVGIWCGYGTYTYQIQAE